ncbi:type 1 glutamine amidotransferase domain-containing protein [Chitinophaga deserti]|uniref:type 1 glutamine amidotransferase domain-containing protein n=1 Tax=Chitinophaga deserti TaxID=2164099 RepID=UPI000D6BC74F|nr:type 1 glutamine amidotransferase domain-containing protein [Chitinophaga deserti]
MEKQTLQNKKVAVLVANGFEESEFTEPVKALKNAGAEVTVVSLKSGKVKAWAEKNWGGEYDVDATVDKVSSESFDALVLPGGVMNPDLLRASKDAVEFVKGFSEEAKPIAAICHGPWTLIEAGIAQGRKMTSYHSIKTDLINAGADWTDQEVVTDNGLVTSRSPEDLPAFCAKMIEEIAEGQHLTRNRGVHQLG